MQLVLTRGHPGWNIERIDIPDNGTLVPPVRREETLVDLAVYGGPTVLGARAMLDQVDKEYQPWQLCSQAFPNQSNV